MAGISIDISELVALATRLRAAPAAIRAGIKAELTSWGAEDANVAVRNVSGKILSRRSGALAQRIGFRVGEEGTDQVLKIGVFRGEKVLRYAAVHDPPDDRTETVIVPRPPRKLLTIPLDAAKYPTGVPRFTAREAASVYEDTFWLASKKTKVPILYGIPRGLDASLIPLFVGVPRVTIPARRPIGQARDEVFPKLRASLQTTVTRILGEQAGAR